jgi:S1-C subfamily serine protease
VDGAAKITIKTSKGTHEAKILSSDKSNDIAILKILGIKEPLVAASIASSSDVKLGQSVFTLGFPNIDVQGFNLKMTKGDISSVSGIQDDPRQFQISVPVQAGNSGGPLFDESGNIVGIVVSKLNAAFMAKHSGDLPQNVNYAVKSAYLMPLLDQFINQLPAPNKRTDDVKTEELVNKVKDACVMILVE